MLADILIDSDRRPRPTQVSAYNDFHHRNWDAIRAFIAIHYKYNTRLDTAFWRACRADTDLAGAERIVDYYKENGPSPLCQELLFDPFDQFKLAGYTALLIGMKVPFERTHTPTEAEQRTWNTKRQRFKEAATKALTVREALDIIHSPRWRWG
jgi:tryptophan halogenase